MKKGMTIADIGAGRGRMTVFFSLRVGEDGRVFANDTDENVLKYPESSCKENNMTNVKTFPGKVDDPMLPAGKVGIVLSLCMCLLSG